MQLTQEQATALKSAVETGLPLTPRPYLTLANALGTSEQAIITTLQSWLNTGLIKRLGIVVQHRKLGYTANAMVVWDIPDSVVDQVASQIAAENCVTLCYRRPRRLPEWPYNLFSMIHGKDRQRVLKQLEKIVHDHGLEDTPKSVLFSTRQFKQRGGQYTSAPPTQAERAAQWIR